MDFAPNSFLEFGLKMRLHGLNGDTDKTTPVTHQLHPPLHTLPISTPVRIPQFLTPLVLFSFLPQTPQRTLFPFQLLAPFWSLLPFLLLLPHCVGLPFHFYPHCLVDFSSHSYPPSPIPGPVDLSFHIIFSQDLESLPIPNPSASPTSVLRPQQTRPMMRPLLSPIPPALHPSLIYV